MGVQHTVARHWASPRGSAEFATQVKGVGSPSSLVTWLSELQGDPRGPPCGFTGDRERWLEGKSATAYGSPDPPRLVREALCF